MKLANLNSVVVVKPGVLLATPEVVELKNPLPEKAKSLLVTMNINDGALLVSVRVDANNHGLACNRAFKLLKTYLKGTDFKKRIYRVFFSVEK